MIYLVVYLCARYSLFIFHYLWCFYSILNRPFVLFVVRLFVLFPFFIDSLLVCCSKEKRTILILNRVQLFRSRYPLTEVPVVPATCFNIII